MRKLAYIVEIESCEPVPDSDRLSVATMVGKGWQVVVGRDEFKPGDLCVYFEIDSYLPADDERYAFLRDRCLRKFVSKSGQLLDQGLRIKTVKLRGVLSQGLLMPIAAFVGSNRELQVSVRPADDDPTHDGMSVVTVGYSKRSDDGAAVDETVSTGCDLTALLRVRHFDEIQEALRPVDISATGGDTLAPFPSDYIPKTDEERVQNLGDWFSSMKGRLWEVTVKADGSSCTMFYAPGVDPEHPFGVCSRNRRIKPEDNNGTVPVMWQLAAKYGVERALREHHEQTGAEWAVQGEAVGPGIQSCRNRETQHEFKVFRIWDIGAQRFVAPAERRRFCERYGIPHVEVLAEAMDVFQEYPDVDSLLAFAEGKTAAGHEREGLVFKTVDEPFLSFKAVSNRYLLKQG